MTAHLEQLNEHLTHPLIGRHDAGFEEAASAWNRVVVQHPLAVAYPQTVTETQDLVRAAALDGVGVTVQPTGHGANGSFDDCILIRPDAFDEITIDVAHRSARVGAGVLWGDVVAALDGTGLLALAGSNPMVSVVGYSLGGGHSAFSRAFGLASDAITAIELVDAVGKLHRITAESDADLFWALRGGGGLFGVVTAIEFTLFAAPALYGGKLSYSDSDGEAVFAAAIEVMRSAPEQLSLYPGMLALPDLPFIPEPLRGSTFTYVDVVFVGEPDAAEALIAPLRAAAHLLSDTLGAFTIAELPAVAAEPTESVAVHDWSTMLHTIDDTLGKRLVAGFREAAVLGASLLQVRFLGGVLDADALGGGGGVATASGCAAMCFTNAVIFNPTMALGAAAALEPLRAATAAHAAVGSIVSLLPHGADLGGAYDAPTLARLRTIKGRVDPGKLFRSNRPLPNP